MRIWCGSGAGNAARAVQGCFSNAAVLGAAIGTLHRYCWHLHIRNAAIPRPATVSSIG